jgi:hypothetical protein
MSKWEYCAVGAIHKMSRNFDTSYPVLWYFTVAGVRAVDITGGAKQEPFETARIVAELGDEGWEMVASGSANEGYNHILYFKRQKA